MYIFRCNKCGWLGCEEYLCDWKCPDCNDDSALEQWFDWTMTFNDKELEVLWELFGDIRVNDNDQIQEEFLDFQVGDDRMEVWKWFDEHYTGGVAKLAGLI